MINSRKIALYSIAILFGFSIFVIVENYWFNQLYRNPISPSLYRITAMDKRLNEKLIKSHQFTVKNYDFIGVQFRQINKEIGDLLDNKIVRSDKKISRAVERIKEKYEEKYDLVDQYTRSNSLVINSISYLPQFIDRKARSKGRKFDKLNRSSIVKLYEYYFRPTKPLREELSLLAKKVSRNFSGNEKKQYLAHIDVVLNESVFVKESIEKFLDVNVQKSVKSLRQIEAQSFKDKLIYNRLIIFGFSFLLVAIGLLFKLILVQRTNREMEIKKELDDQISRNNNNSKMAALGEMAGQIAHEINTPLGTLFLISQSLIKKSAKGNLSGDFLEKQLSLLLAITEKISKIVKTMKDFARSGVDVQHEEVPIQKIIDDVLLLSGQKIKKNGADFEIIYGVDKDKELNCCSFQIVQVLLNLLSNALHAVEKVDDPWVKMKILEVDRHLRVEFIDSGKGVPQGAKSKIFDHKFTTKALGEGTGIGLSVSKEIIEKGHGGKLYLDDSQEGTAFVFEIPLDSLDEPVIEAA